ncbi:testis-expressed protein 2-like [Salvia splendens]|uniref:testis-expressed protein 2-like n=1 Tax=Salvia splendens TaxID=180675 RepID=UPI001C279BC6|nr:testis-expressed protein 2-like [Salvia splendens]XP_042016824.1 testis-expressed protein 2-like [Salvia splendens]
MAVLLVLAFIIGAISVLAIEAAALWILIRRLDRKVAKEEDKTKAAGPSALELSTFPSLYDKQGTLWILEPDKIPKSRHEDKVPKEHKRKKEILEVTPVRKNARIRDHYLVLMEADVSRVEIPLRGCSIVAVSATDLPSRKWAKRYPIKVESKDSAIYKGSKIIYLYLDTAWEKESWCKVLRLASCDDGEKNSWFSKLTMEFQHYLASLNAGYPSFIKPSGGVNAEPVNRTDKLDNSSSRVRHFLKKLAKKASKSAHDYKPASISGHEERKVISKSQDMVMPNGSAKIDTTAKLPNAYFTDTSMTSSVSPSELSGLSEADSKEKYIDEGTLCLNMVISRLFFDAKNNLQLRSSLHTRIQKALSNMRIPSYIGEVTCTAVDPGTLPPRILAMRVLPSDMNEVWSMEIDVEYLGGMVLDIITRLELRELEVEEEKTRLNGNGDGEVPSDLLEGFEYLGKELKLGEETNTEGYHDTDDADNPRNSGNSPAQGSKWKSILHSITKQVSQVPLSLVIRISSISGTIRVCMKPPPSDQIWFVFTSMPDIQFNLDSFVGDHKITNARLALFLISRIKAAIRETLVLPNSESIILPWMLAEKDDWVPRKAAPFMWYKNNHDSVGMNSRREAPSFQPGELAHNAASSHGNSSRSEVDYEVSKNPGSIPEGTGESVGPCVSSSSSTGESMSNSSSSQDLRAPLLKDEKMHESTTRSIEPRQDTCVHSPSRFFTTGDDDMNPKKMGTKERMRGLGKKVGEKLEVKRRNFEERGRSFVERMRGP